jgi:hypothetical protein
LSSVSSSSNPSILFQVLKDQTAASAARALSQELELLTNQARRDPAFYPQFKKEMQAGLFNPIVTLAYDNHAFQDFFLLFTRYLATKVKGDRLDWDKISSPNTNQVYYLALFLEL